MRRRFRASLVSFLLFSWFFAVPVGATGAGLAVGGKVLVDEKPLAGAELTLRPILPRYAQALEELEARPGEPTARATTGADGRFELIAPAAGMWRLRVEAKGRPTSEIDLTPLLEAVELPPAELGKPSGDPLETRSRWRQTPAGWSWAVVEEAAKAKPAAGTPRKIRIVDPQGEPLAAVILVRAGDTMPLGRSDAAGEATLTVPVDALLLDLLSSSGALARVRLEPPTGDPETPTVLVFEAVPALTGRVVERASRRPLAGAWVWVPWRAGDHARSDTAGGYALQGFPEPPGALAAAMSDFATATERINASERSLPTLALQATGRLGGRVLDSAGKPVADVEILASLQLETPALAAVFAAVSEPVKTRSSARGEFHLAGLLAGQRYRLELRKTGFAPSKRELEPLAPSERRRIDIVLERGRTVVGEVTDATDGPIAGALARLTAVPDDAPNPLRRVQRLLGEGSSDEVETTTDARGRFKTSGLLPARYRLEVEAEGWAPVTVPGIEVAAGEGEVDLGTVVLAAGVVLEGRVIDPAGVPLEGAEIRTFESTGLPFMPAMMIRLAGDNPVKARSDAEGRFRVRDLPAKVAVGLVVGRSGFISTALEGIEPPRPAPVEVVLQPAAKVSGKVLDGARNPVSDATVLVFVEASGAGRFGAPVFGRSDAEGKFELEGVEPGKVRLSVVARGFQDFTRTGLEVPAGGALEGLELVLTPGAVVQGIVVDEAGDPLIGATVRVLDPREGDLVNRPPQTQTDGDGRYAIDRSAPGPRSVEAVLDGYERGVRDLEVKPGINQVDFVLRGGVEVSGRVTDAGGAGVAGATVGLGGGMLARFSTLQTTTGADGVFRFAGVQPGDYQLSADKTGYAAAQGSGVIEVRAQPLVGLELVLETGARVFGAVRGLSFEELGRLTVRGFSEGQLVDGQVDYEGRYELAHLGVAEWSILAEVTGSGRNLRETVVIEPGSTGVERDLVFGGGYTLSGIATRSSGEPIAGAMLLAQGKSVGRGGRVNTLHDGSFRIEGLEADVYQLVLMAFGTGLSHTEEVEIQGDTEMQLEVPTGFLRGKVRDEDGPVEGANVAIRAVDSEDPGFAGPGVGTGADGGFDLGEVAAKRWRVVASKPGYAAATAEVELGDGESKGDVELELVPSEGLRFRVGWAAGGEPRSVQVLVVGASGIVVDGSFTTGERGKVWLSQVPAGAWRLLVLSGESAVSALEVQAPADLGRIVLEPGGRLEVQVGELIERPVEAQLTLVGAGGQVFIPLAWGATGKSEIALGAGRTRVSNVPAGTWKAMVTAADGRSWSGEVQVVPGASVELSLP